MAATPDPATPPARMVPIPVKQWPSSMREALAVMRPENARHEPLPTEGRPKGINALGVLAKHPVLTKAWNTFNGHVLLGTTLSTRQRELLVLRVAAVRKAEYEWAQHVIIGQDVGITLEEIDRVQAGPAAQGWSPLESALLSATDELLGDAKIADLTWAVLSAELDEQQLLDLVFTVGAYDLLAMAFRSFEIPLDDDLRK